jgi:hypothetical protein
VSRNLLYAVVVALAVVAAVLGYRLYEERQNSTTIGINVGEHSISIEKH